MQWCRKASCCSNVLPMSGCDSLARIPARPFRGSLCKCYWRLCILSKWYEVFCCVWLDCVWLPFTLCWLFHLFCFNFVHNYYFALLSCFLFRFVFFGRSLCCCASKIGKVGCVFMCSIGVSLRSGVQGGVWHAAKWFQHTGCVEAGQLEARPRIVLKA